jgi:hypothetical protein
MAVLTPDEVRLYIQDYPEVNVLLDDVEFADPNIQLAIKMAISDFNVMTPRSNFTGDSFPSVSLLMLGTLYHLFLGAAAKYARNHLTYSDGGLSVPIEEKYELYKNLSDSFYGQFNTAAAKLKINLNMESGWGYVSSDEAFFPIY